MMSIEEKLDEILKRAVRKARATDSTAWYFDSDWHKHQILELIKEARKELFNLYGSPRCEYLHHPKKYQHSITEVCPIEEKLNQLSQQTPNK